jgi:arylsulfatase A-like enzyme
VRVSRLAACCWRLLAPRRPQQALPSGPSILLVTLDTTRADAIGSGRGGADTGAFDALDAQGRRFRQAYATVPRRCRRTRR